MDDNLEFPRSDEPESDADDGMENEARNAPLSPVAEGAGLNGNGPGEAVAELNTGLVRNVLIEQEMRSAYLDYAMSVIVARALPDARDGLKPVHRRILYAMHDMGLAASSSYKKSARIVGEVLGKYHPHGDTAVYDAMARMAQDFSLRYCLVDGQGNFGSVDGDSPAAMRYTEARLSRIAETMLQDIEMDTVDWTTNFDDSLEEPTVLPGMLPNLLVNGTSGIAVGMATNIPPHNLSEIADAVAFVIDNWERRSEIGLEELMEFAKGPDFPTGGIILGTEGIKQAFATGRGKILVRAQTTIEEIRGGRFAIIVTEIPYQVNKSTLIERMAELVREGRLDMISDLRDESDRTGMRIVIELKRNAAPKKARNRLFKHTQLQASFGVNTLALVNGEPVTLGLRRALVVYIEHRFEVLTRRTQYQLAKARERAHILEGLRIALEFLDEIIATIRRSDSAEAARAALMENFGLSQVQAQAILDLQLRRLAALERQKIEDEYQEILARIAYYEDLLANPDKLRALIRADILMLKEKFGDPRRSMIVGDANGEFTEEDLIAQDNVLISYSAGAYIKRMSSEAFRAQNRGGRGVKGMATRSEDEVADLLFARTLDHILFFTNKGRVYSSRVYELPEGSRTARGMHIANVLSLMPDETVTTMLVVPDFEHADYITLLTRQGRIKRMELNVFANIRSIGLIAMSLDEGDSLDWARLTNGSEDFIVVTRHGRALRFSEKDVRAMGRTAAGVMAIRLQPQDDEVVGFDVVKPEAELLVVHEHGYGKRTPLAEYTAHSRYTQGNWATDHTRLDEVGPIVAARVVEPADQITVMTANGIVLRTRVDGIRAAGRITRGVRVVNLLEGDTVAAVAVMTYADLNRGVDDGGETGADLALNGSESETSLPEVEGAPLLET
ncbi:MAG: DNA gyrase subunit A [Caldilineaceae bacterium]|jgi:DNA gyrase subunit A|nr:DNA gyrase subunit A [Caldilineaceae bacterium]